MSTRHSRRSRSRHSRALHAEAAGTHARRRRQRHLLGVRSEPGDLMFRLFVCLVMIAGTAGCAARSRPPSVSSAPAAHTQRPPDDSLAVFMDKVRAKSERARPPANRVQDRRGIRFLARGSARRPRDSANRRQPSHGRRTLRPARHPRPGPRALQHGRRARSNGCGLVGRARAHLARLGISPPCALRCVSRRLLRSRLPDRA